MDWTGLLAYELLHDLPAELNMLALQRHEEQL